MSKAREQKCPGCKGIVRIPKGKRAMTLDAVMETHAKVCPVLGRRGK